MMRNAVPVIEKIAASALRIPTDAPEQDGTFAWDHTTIVIVEAFAGGRTGLGYSYTGAAAANLINVVLAEQLTGAEAFAIPLMWERMVGAVRNLGSRGICATAISAVDTALWDLKARLMDVPLAGLLGAARDAVPIYGSGGFTSYPVERVAEQLGGWIANEGCRY